MKNASKQTSPSLVSRTTTATQRGGKNNTLNVQNKFYASDQEPSRLRVLLREAWRREADLLKIILELEDQLMATLLGQSD